MTARSAVAIGFVRALVLPAPTSVPRVSALTVDANVLAFTLAAAIVTSIVFGMTPALSMSERFAHGSFALNSRGAVGARTRRAPRLLVAVELAFAVMLLVGSGLLIRSYLQLQQVEPGC